MLHVSLLEWFGYASSVVVAVSLTMSSIVRLRWFNLVGAAMFSLYGFLIGALPVGFLNLFIALADVYYLVRIYTDKEMLTTLRIENDHAFLNHFLDFHWAEISKIFPSFKKDLIPNLKGFYILRNDATAGVILGQIRNGEFQVELDYVTPSFRDFKVGKYIFNQRSSVLKEMGVHKVLAQATTPQHKKYLVRMGFAKKEEQAGQTLFERILPN